ncbi:MAG: 30S ribosomal protein S12 methylthiotransferase RimO [Spirochaetes bacterium]|nr:30S ribosomal protein S12 methylthiotransferase RimO [Spirochaetota bacterium]MBU1081215.1 30S ribosomal protein S12 methylthiotransferase RimO [Spirochaetota bacterium]
MKTFYIDNHGCAKNQVDAEEMAARLVSEGWASSASLSGAALVIVNTCGFIEDAKKESLEAVIAVKAAYPGKRVLVAGCLSQRYADALGSDLAEADGVFGNGDLSLVGRAADAALRGDRRTTAPERVSYAPARRGPLMGFPRSAYLKIAEGCDNRCSFCAIPLIRGGISSRDPEDAAAEFSELVSSGAYEVCLIGQDLGSYGQDRAGRQLLPDLLSAISSVPGDWRLRMLYIHPDRFPRAVLDACASDERILPYFDLPFQHASERVLRAMNRSGDADRYLGLLSDIRGALPAAVIRSTFLVGFPGEDDDDFAALRRFQDAARVDWLGAFAYSREEDTPAYSLKGRVAKRVAQGRKKEIEDAQRPLTEAALERFVGTAQTVLVEERIEGEDLAIARGYMNAPDVDGSVVVVGGDLSPGDVLPVTVLAVRGVDLEAAPRAR